jgi:post-segregation antitoxin (ccd killing protein)
MKGSRSSTRPAARKRPVNLTLNAELVRQVKATTTNLSAVIGELLVDHLRRRERERVERAQSVKGAVRQWNDFAQQFGSLADEYSPL